MIAYFNGSFLEKEDIAISPDDRGFLFADALYEVIHSYDGRLFRMDDHMARLRYGARELGFTDTEFDGLDAACERLIDENDLQSGHAVVYIEVSRGAAVPRAHVFPPVGTPLTVYAAASSFTPKHDQQESGVRLLTVPDQRWARCDIKTVALTANVLACETAHAGGAAEALFVRDGMLMEGSHSSFLAVFNGVVTAPPLSNYLLGSITRMAVEDLCRELALPLTVRSMPVADLTLMDEAFIVGTTVEITPVLQVDDRVISDTPGPVTRRLQAAFRALVS